MKTAPLKNLLKLLAADIKPAEREALNKVVNDTKLRNKLIKQLQEKGIGKKVDSADTEKWLELILKYLPTVLQLIMALIA